MNSLKKTLSHSQKRLEIFLSYDVESLFTNIPLKESVNYILNQIYVHKILPQIYSRHIFKRLLMKRATEVTFTFNNKFCKQTDGCTMGGLLSVTTTTTKIFN